MSDSPADVERDLQVLETDLKRLEAEYNMFFAGRLPKPPWETRGRVDALVKRMDRVHLPGYATRFRFTTLQTRYATFVDLWDRGLRAREEGRQGPFSQLRPSEARPDDRILHVAMLTEPLRENDKLQDLYHSVAEARRLVGEETIPFHRFAELVNNQVATMRKGGTTDVAFRVAIKDGKVAFTARGLKGAVRP